MRHEDIIKWKHFPHYWSFVRGIHWSPVNSPHKSQWRRALMFDLPLIALNPPGWWTPSGIYGIEGPSEICTQSTEMWLAVSGAQPLFTLGLLMFALSLVDFLSLLLSPSTDFKIFYFCQKYHLKDTYRILKKISCWFKIWMGFVVPILIKFWTSSIWGFL